MISKILRKQIQVIKYIKDLKWMQVFFFFFYFCYLHVDSFLLSDEMFWLDLCLSDRRVLRILPNRGALFL